jgi:hypothetical protein
MDKLRAALDHSQRVERPSVDQPTEQGPHRSIPDSFKTTLYLTTKSEPFAAAEVIV